MVVGNGMIAKAFKQYENNDNVILFASGVSNSKEDNSYEFERELTLLKSHTGLTDKKLIYFSTCSIFDKSISNNKYIKHKLHVESFIVENFNSYLIFRLPNVIGHTDNKDTSFSFFKNQILNNKEIQIQKNTTRYIIDIDDLKNTLPFIISSDLYQKDIINVCFDNKISIEQLIETMEKILQTNTIKKILHSGFDYEVDNKEFIDIVEKQNYKISKDYNFMVLKKYLNVACS